MILRQSGEDYCFYLRVCLFCFSVTVAGCGFQLETQSAPEDREGNRYSINFKGNLEPETRSSLEKYCTDHRISTGESAATVTVEFDETEKSERASQYDALGNAIEFSLREVWRFHLVVGDIEKSRNAYQIQAVSQYRQDENALLATSAQQSRAESEIKVKLMRDLIELISIEVSKVTLKNTP